MLVAMLLLGLLPSTALAGVSLPVVDDEAASEEAAAETGDAEVGSEAEGGGEVGTTSEPDPRVGLGGGVANPATAALNLDLLSNSPKPAGFFNPASLGSLSFANSDLAFQGDRAFVGSFHGFNVYDISNPEAPVLELSYVCPGGQGDLSIYGDLLFMSVEETRGKIDCTSSPAATATTRFRGVRIFDISDYPTVVQLPGVQTCAGSHTHTLLKDPDDDENVYIYNSGTAGVRSSAELAGCNANSSLTDPTTTNFSIDVIKVPLDAPETAHVVSRPRIFSTCGSSACIDDFASGALNGLPGSGTQPQYPAGDPRAPGGQSRSQATRCHDITLYPEIGLGAGACQGWGLLLDISDPVNPVRIHEVEDYNFAYWHSATFNNDGTKVIFTDEWGGGTGARCRPADRLNWGANALFDIVQTEQGPKMEWRSYYKMPAPQTNQENCVAHNGSLVPVPGRDIMTQAWYQGGISVFDFTDTENPVEIAFFDRGPFNPSALQTAGLWSTYWFNGAVYGSEIGRGFDVFDLLESEHLNAVELAAADQVRFDELNVQMQPRLTWPATFTTARAWHSAAQRQDVLDADVDANLTKFIDRAEQHSTSANATVRNSAAANLRAVSNQLGGSVVEQGLRDALHALADGVARGR